MRFTKLDYCQYLLSSPVNYTITNLADHLEEVSHDRINQYLANEKLTPQSLWENVQSRVVRSQKAFILFDDTVLDKRYARKVDRTYAFGLILLVLMNHKGIKAQREHKGTNITLRKSC